MNTRWKSFAMGLALSAAAFTAQAAGALQLQPLHARDVPTLLQTPHARPLIVAAVAAPKHVSFVGQMSSIRSGTTRALAVEISADLRNGEFLDQSFERRTGMIDARDRRWMRELIYGMLRKRGRIDALLETRVRGTLSRLDADVLDLMRLGVYQLLEMGSVPAYAAIAQTVELAKRRHGLGASKLVNAVLRRLDRERDDLGQIR